MRAEASPIVALSTRPTPVSLAPRSREIRTSGTHPLIVAWAPRVYGRLGITICPGKTGEVSASGLYEHRRSLLADAAVLQALGVERVVSLLEKHEIARARVEASEDTYRAMGIRFTHVPIRDVSIPQVLGGFRAYVNEVACALEDGETVVVHCMGGLGRSGVFAGCVMRSMGAGFDEALADLHAMRGPKCPETAEQRVFLQRWSS